MMRFLIAIRTAEVAMRTPSSTTRSTGPGGTTGGATNTPRFTRRFRLKPKIISSQIITGIDGPQSQLINRMRHADMIMRGQTLYILEVYPAAYAALAANEAEKAADVHLMEVITFGAFGRLWMGGSEAEIAAAAAAAEGALAKVTGRESK